MSEAWEGFRQWWYPPPFRIRSSSPEIGRLCLELDLIRKKLDALSTDTEERTKAAPVIAAELDKNFAVALCNNLHRLDRCIARVAKQGSDEADRLQDHIARVRSDLEEKGVTYEDLTGQEYSSGRADFEPLGTPQPVSGIRWPTIMQCERPVVLRNGKILQCAKGVVGAPS
jgi:hypothetical protein